jgi:hypothetical protein
MFHLLVRQTSTDRDLRIFSINLNGLKFVYTSESDDIGWLAMIEIDFDHQVSAALNELG